MDVQAKLAEVRRTVEQAWSMPMSASAVVNRAELLGLLDELRERLGSAFTDADAVATDRDSIVEDARREAEQIIEKARGERAEMLSDTEVFRVARRRAEEVVEHARTEADALHAETDDYVDTKLANFEITLERTTAAVKRGRERLAGRSAFAGLTTEEADKITLPEHLEG